MLRGIVPEIAAEPVADALDVDQSIACVVQVCPGGNEPQLHLRQVRLKIVELTIDN